MSTIRTLVKDNFDTELQIQGARAQNSNDDIASVVFTNYDNDTSNIYRLAEIVTRDNFGSAASNGCGNIVMKTNPDGGSNLVDRMVVKCNGYVGINTPEPISHLHVVGNITACNLLYSTQPIFYPFTKQLATYSNVYTNVYSWQADNRPLSNVDVRAFAVGASSSYVLRLYDVDVNSEIGKTPFALSNTKAVMVTIAAASNNTRSNQSLELHVQGTGSVLLDGMMVRFS